MRIAPLQWRALCAAIQAGEYTREDFLRESRESFEEKPLDENFTAEQAERYMDLLYDAIEAGADEEGLADLMLRAMAIYRAFLRHAEAGGKVVFTGVGVDRTLKLRRVGS